MSPVGEAAMRAHAMALAAGVLITFSGAAMADFWSKARDTLGDVGTAVWHVNTAPVEAVVNGARVVAGRSDPQSIFDPYQRAASATGDAVEGGYSLASQPKDFLYQKAQKYARKAGGDTGAFVFDVATFNDKLFSDLGKAGVGATANALRGQNPLQITAAPLAAAIMAARDAHYANSRPLPDDVRNSLTGILSDATLQRARYAIGEIEITLPNLIGTSHRFMGDEHAVTVDDIIVFNDNPPRFRDDPEWWAHELIHVGQYRLYGVERFAWEYARDLGHTIEGEANQNARSVIAALNGENVQWTQPLVTSNTTTVPQVPNPYVVRCYFADSAHIPIAFLVTRSSQIYAVNVYTGQSFQVGWATAPRAPGVAWTYQTTNAMYAVLPDGRILWPAGGWVQVGFAQLL